jgi:hypothetical protein
MSAKVKKYMPLLHLLSRASPYMRKNILSTADDDFIKIIIECCYNTLVGNIKLSKIGLKKLKSYKHIIRKVSKPSKNIKNTKKILVQDGGAFLPLILPSLIAGLVSLIK